MNSVGTYITSFLICFTLGIEGRKQLEVYKKNITNAPLLDLTKSILNNGYLATEHVIETADGYLLTVFRIQKPGIGKRRPPVLLMHGLLLSAAIWIEPGPKIALGYLLADAGHDVWIGNARGSYYSRQHAWLNPDTDAEYWYFCVDEIGYYDHPAVIDYILSETGASKLNYIGFSQGGGTLFIMCSEKPEYCNKINLMIGIAPATRHLFTKSVIFNAINEYHEIYENILKENSIGEVFSVGGLFQSFIEFFCRQSDQATSICEAFLRVFDAVNPDYKTKKSALRTIVSSIPAGTSVHNLARYGQSYKTEHFQKFDYGTIGNLERYRSKTAPLYNLSSVIVPTVIIYSRNDAIVDIKDVKWLIQKLPNVIESYEVKDPFWSHMDIFLSKNMPNLVYPKIEEYLNKFDCEPENVLC